MFNASIQVSPKNRHANSPRYILETILLAAILIPVTASAQVLLNGDFENPGLPDGTFSTTPATSWVGGAFLDNPNIAGKLANQGFTWPQAASGEQYADIGDTPSFALSQSIVLPANTTLNISWFDNTALNILSGFQTAPYSLIILNPAAQSVFSVDHNSYRSSGTWQARSETASLVAGGSYTVVFSSRNVFNGTDTLIDNVQVSAVPEESSAMLLIAGAVGIFAARACRACRTRRHPAV